MIKVMNVIQKIAMISGFIGLMALTGCVENGTGWIPTLTMIFGGIGVAGIIEYVFRSIGEIQ